MERQQDIQTDVRRYIHDITPSLHVLVVNANIPDTISLKEMIILLCHTTCVNSAAFGTTVVKISSGYINAIVEINESSGTLQAKLTFDTGTEYTAMEIKINIIYF